MLKIKELTNDEKILKLVLLENKGELGGKKNMKKIELWNLADHGTVENSIVKYLQFLNGVEKGKDDLKHFAEAFSLKKHQEID